MLHVKSRRGLRFITGFMTNKKLIYRLGLVENEECRVRGVENVENGKD